ncbi:hypothetical protein [Pedobacter sp. MR22-3]|uniref:hypothetical protein n=1 Tax=Pedobacter sp. MR22-3 TaxID=2994552 RepID=UPI00224646AE|nr:hypothetical protein [Pedobacter sp. MR22-3]MCX2584605.1 hypothetical protein [Pedobacter sp. MR22-3]
MRKIIILDICFCLITIILYCSCKRYETKSINNRDSVLILNVALNHILKQNVLPKEYYSQPLQLIQPKGFNKDVKIVVNGKGCVMLPEGTKIMDILSRKNIYNPIPFTEVIQLELKNGLIYIEIIFRSTGHDFQLRIKKKEDSGFEVIGINERTI